MVTLLILAREVPLMSWKIPYRLAVSVAITALALGCGQATPREQEIKLDIVKQAKVLEAIQGQPGKVVVVDIWGEFCIPCKAEFPHLVALHKKYRTMGVTCMSVSVDPEPEKAHTAALKFLKDKEATFANYLLDEEPKAWQDHFDIYGPPAVFVYDQKGKLAGRFDHNDPDKQYTYADVEKLVEKLLN
jgi:thiol-disulfide isomerase/thioredoxin